MRKFRPSRYISGSNSANIIILLSVILISAAIIISISKISAYTEEATFKRIDNSTNTAAKTFYHSMNQMQTELNIFANLLGTNDYNSDDALQKHMAQFCRTRKVSAIRILLKDNTAISYGVYPQKAAEELKFEDELARIPYTSNIIKLGDMRSQQYIYQTAPVIRNGETIAILYGYISLSQLSVLLPASDYDGRMVYYVINAENGNMIIDEYHRYSRANREIPLQNIYNAQPREPMEGHTWDDFFAACKDGRPASIVCKSLSIDEWCYIYSTPLGINNWSLVSTIDTPTAFANYNYVKKIYAILVGFILVIFIIIIMTMLLQRRNERRIETAKIQQSACINDIQGALIGAQNNPSFMRRALHLVADEVSAYTALITTFTNNVVMNVYVWTETDIDFVTELKGIDVSTDFPEVLKKLNGRKNLFADKYFIAKHLPREKSEHIKNLGIRNIFFVPLFDNDGMLKSNFMFFNIKPDKHQIKLIESIAGDFYLAITSIEHNNLIKKISTRDTLTGVGNRHAMYEYIKTLRKSQELGVIFCDVTGLKRANDLHGHEAGDRLLMNATRGILGAFEKNQVFRIGGDEFVIMCDDMTKLDMMQRIVNIQTRWYDMGVTVALGHEWIESYSGNPDRLTTVAEAKMYQAKNEWYSKSGIDRRADRRLL